MTTDCQRLKDVVGYRTGTREQAFYRVQLVSPSSATGRIRKEAARDRVGACLDSALEFPIKSISSDCVIAPICPLGELTFFVPGEREYPVFVARMNNSNK